MLPFQFWLEAVNSLMNVSDLICIAEKVNPMREKAKQKKCATFSLLSHFFSILDGNTLCHIFNLTAFLSFSAPRYFNPRSLKWFQICNVMPEYYLTEQQDNGILPICLGMNKETN